MVLSLDATLRLIILAIVDSYHPWERKERDIAAIRLAIPMIAAFVQTPTPEGPLVHSYDNRLNELTCGRKFNELAFLDYNNEAIGEPLFTYNYLMGLLYYSTPSELNDQLGLDLKFLRDYGFSFTLSLITPLDLGRLMTRQRQLTPKVVCDVHDIFSRPHYNGQVPTNVGITVGLFVIDITSQYRILTSKGMSKKYFTRPSTAPFWPKRHIEIFVFSKQVDYVFIFTRCYVT